MIDLQNVIDLNQFKEYLEKEALSDKTKDCYIRTIDRFLGMYDTLTIDSFRDFLIKFVYKTNSNGYMFYYAIIKFIKFKFPLTEQTELIKQLEAPKLKNSKTPRVILNKEKRLELLSNLINDKHQMIALIQILTGARAGDVLRIPKGNIILQDNILQFNIIGKGNKPNLTTIKNKDFVKIIWDYICKINNKSKYYFINKNYSKLGKELGSMDDYHLYTQNYQRYWEDLKQACNTTGINPKLFSTHDFRRCFANDIWQSSEHDIFQLKQLLHHSNITTTDRYINQSGLATKETLEAYQDSI